MCGRLLVGKSKRRVALLVGAALYALEGVLVGARSSSRVMMALRRELLGGKKVADWLLNLPVSWMALIVFVATYHRRWRLFSHIALARSRHNDHECLV